MVPIKIKLDDSFFSEEVRNGYIVSAKMKKIWAVLLDLLNEFSNVCKKYNIEWYADAGTILGAVRHGGFIPWDDDIDVMMSRKNYNKLCKIAEKEFHNPYFFQTEYSDVGSVRGHAQLRNSLTTGILANEESLKLQINQGIFLDIFPIDNLPDNLHERNIFLNNVAKAKFKANRIANLTTRYHKKNNSFRSVIKSVLHFLLGLVGKNELKAYRKYELLEQKYISVDTKEVAKLFCFPFKERRVWKREWFNGIVFLKFEMMEIPVPTGYLDLLDKFYGNWHEFKIGTSTHGEVKFDPEKCYKEYIK